MISDDILKKIKEEISNDPEGVGYFGKTDDEILKLLNNSVRKERVIEDVYPSPINRILSGMSETPNTIDLTELQAAKII